jgi:hypothetical protein
MKLRIQKHSADHTTDNNMGLTERFSVPTNACVGIKSFCCGNFFRFFFFLTAHLIKTVCNISMNKVYLL